MAARGHSQPRGWPWLPRRPTTTQQTKPTPCKEAEAFTEVLTTWYTEKKYHNDSGLDFVIESLNGLLRNRLVIDRDSMRDQLKSSHTCKTKRE